MPQREKFTWWMVLSFFVPIFGGVAAYYSKRERNRELASMLLIGSFTLPAQIVIGVLSSLVGLPLLTLIIMFLLVVGLRYLLDNYYSGLLWAYYFGLIGAFYPYYRIYSDDEATKKSVGWFAFIQMFLFIILNMVFSALIAQTAPPLEAGT